MNLRVLVAAFAVGSLCLVSCASAPTQSTTVALRGVTIVDVTDGSLRSEQTVLIGGNRIAAVGPVAELDVPAAAEIVEARGHYLIPGLWDMHAHAATEGRVPSFFRLFLANGITGFRDPFGSLEVAARARASLEAGELPGPPRVVVAGNLVDGSPGSITGSLVASSPEDGRRIVDSLHAAGAPFVKIYHSLSPETYSAIAERASQLDIAHVGHVPLLVRAADASAAGLRSNEHLFGVLEGCSSDEEAIIADFGRSMDRAEAGDIAALAKMFFDRTRHALATQDDDRCRLLAEEFIENETWQVPTLVSLRGKYYARELAAGGDSRARYFTPPRDWFPGRFGLRVTEEQEEIFRGRYERETAIVRMMAASGVPFLAGTDAPVSWAFPGFGLHDELELLVEAGLTPLQALQAATLNPARFFGRTDELGTVAEGKLADLVLLDGNPLQDITNTQRIRAVVADGHVYRRSDLDRLVAEVEASNTSAGSSKR